jgi:hypothetical protein
METPPNDQSFVQKIQARLAASRFFTFSLLLHIVIVVMGGSVVLFKQMTDPPDFVSEGGGLVTEDVSIQPPEQPQTPVETTMQPVAPQVTAPQLAAITTNATVPTAFQMAAAVPQIKAPAADAMAKAVTEVARGSMTKGSGNLPATMGGRAGGMARSMAMQKTGGKDKSEKAVMAGLRWLKQTQNENGSWTKDSETIVSAMTGLATLCFLGHGELPESPEFGPTVKKAVDYLLAQGTKHQGKLVPRIDQPGCYAHAIAAYALGEYFTMTKDERVKDVLTQAVKYIVDGQAPDGGWQYGYAKGIDSDTSVTGWQIQALKAAHLTGLQIPGVDEALDKAMPNLKRVQSENGNFGYRRAGDRGGNPSLAGVGVLCSYFWNGEKSDLVRDGIKFILDKHEKDFPIKYKEDKADLYAWYYSTQACLMFGGTAWSKWNRWFQDEICDAQSPDGSWPPHGGKGHGENDGPKAQTYRTTLCILMLEVFYRYMPTTK